MKLVAAIIVLACSCKEVVDDRKPCSNGTARLQIVPVDENSAYMKSVYKHVGPDRENKPTDADTLAAGVTADIDAWNNTETKAGMELLGERHVDYYLVAHDRAALEKYIATLPPVPSDRKLVIEHELPLPTAKDRREYWRTYYVISTAIIDETTIAAAGVEPDRLETGHAFLSVKLTAQGQAAFAEATQKNVGRKFATIVDGSVISAPVIRGAIKRGMFQLQLPTATDANDLLKRRLFVMLANGRLSVITDMHVSLSGRAWPGR